MLCAETGTSQSQGTEGNLCPILAGRAASRNKTHGSSLDLDGNCHKGRAEEQGELIKIMWWWRIKTSLPITEETLKPVTPQKGVYLIHICSQFNAIYSIFYSIANFDL